MSKDFYSGLENANEMMRRAVQAAAQPMPKLEYNPPRNLMVEIAEKNLASEFYKRLVEWINGFDADLDEAHEVGVRLVSFGQSMTFHLDNLGYSNPSLIVFSGKTTQGEPVELIQHVSQISILLMKLPRLEPEKPKRKMGFQMPPPDEA